MKILYLLKQDPEPTLNEILEDHKKGNEVTVVDIRKDKDYNKIVDLIEKSEKIISV
jgi:hypothetical protein